MQNLASLWKSIKTHTATCVRHIIPLVQMAEEYHMYKKGDHGDNGREPAVLFIFDTGYYTVVSGWGELFDVYCSKKKLGTYTGCNVKPRKPGDSNYGDSRLRILPFDQAFHFICKNITDSKVYVLNCSFFYIISQIWYIVTCEIVLNMLFFMSAGEFFNPDCDGVVQKQQYCDGNYNYLGYCDVNYIY